MVMALNGAGVMKTDDDMVRKYKVQEITAKAWANKMDAIPLIDGAFPKVAKRVRKRLHDYAHRLLSDPVFRRSELAPHRALRQQ